MKGSVVQILLIIGCSFGMVTTAFGHHKPCYDNEFTVHVSNHLNTAQRICIEFGSMKTKEVSRKYFDIPPGGFKAVCVPAMERAHSYKDVRMSAFPDPFYQKQVGRVFYTFDPLREGVKPMATVLISESENVPPYFKQAR